MNCSVKSILRLLSQAVCLFLMAVGFVAALIASFFVIAMLIVWFQEGALQTADRKMLGAGAKWLLGAGVLIGGAWWLRGKTVPNPTGDNSFRLVESTARSEKLAQDISGIILVICLAIWLWALSSGTGLVRVPIVAGWITVGFLGLHGRIALHEIGHLAAAWLCRLAPRKIQVGVGPLIWSGYLANGLLWEWRAWPQGGLVIAPDWKTKGFRLRQSLFTAAGPLADVFVLWATYQLSAHVFGGLGAAFAHGSSGFMVFSFFWLTALSTVGGLVPHTVRIGHQKMWNDGYLLLRLWTGGVRFPQLAYNSDWEGLLERLQVADSRSVIPLEAGERELPAHQADPLTFHEQRVLLSSRLLRQRSFTFGPPA
jgi:Peptidase family M50